MTSDGDLLPPNLNLLSSFVTPHTNVGAGRRLTRYAELQPDVGDFILRSLELQIKNAMGKYSEARIDLLKLFNVIWTGEVLLGETVPGFEGEAGGGAASALKENFGLEAARWGRW